MLKFLWIFFFILEAFEPASFKPNVVDDARMLSQAETQRLNQAIVHLQKETGIYAAVYFTSSTQPVSIEEAADLTFQKWKLGKKGQDNGLLFLFALQDRKARIEVGYGLEEKITDLKARLLLDKVILPEFKKQNYVEGVLKGLETLNHFHKRDVEFQEEPRTKKGFAVLGIWLFIVWVGGFILRWRRLKTQHAPVSFLPYLFISAFLSLNPGIFIFLLSDLILKHTRQGQELWIVVYGAAVLFAFSIVTRALGFILGYKRKKSFSGFFKTQPMLLNFIAYFAASAALFFLWKTGPALLLFLAMLAVLMSFAHGFLMLFSRRYGARQRLSRIKTRVEGTREIFGREHTYYRPREIGSSSGGGGWSSSSGGGRSGGGGASSSW